MTEAEWQEIAVQLARKIMGWHLQGGNRPSPNWLDENFEDTGYSLRGPALYAKGFPRWEPPFNITQAMLVKDCIVKQSWRGCRFSMDCVQHLESRVIFQRDEQVYRGHHKVDAKAICLAAMAWVIMEKAYA